MTKKITTDFHLHSDFSGDSDSPMEEMILDGISQDLKIMCFTEHLDKDYAAEVGADFSLDLDGYSKRLFELKDKYASKIDLRFGIELGLQPHLADYHRSLVSDYPFDFVIGSSHTVHGFDPYYPSYYKDRSEEEAYLEYFESIPENLDVFSDFDVYGHIDYVVRYGPNKNLYYSYNRYRDILDVILRRVIDLGLGIECNTGGIKYGLGHPNPCEEVLSRYHELGGEILTIGSDAHCPEHIAYAFPEIPELLKSCGFTYYTVFQNRKAEFLPL